MIIGYEKERNEIARYRNMLLHADAYEKLGLRIPRGLIVHGPHGTGKSALVREIGGDGVNLTVVNLSEVSTDNATEAIEAGMRRAQKNSPGVLVLDELDGLFGLPNPFLDDGNDVGSSLQAMFEGLKESDRILVVATCLDSCWASPTLTRRGRFEKSICVGLPDEETRCAMLDAFLGEIRMERSFSLEEAGRLTAGFSGGEIESLVNEIGLDVAARGDAVMTVEDFSRALNRQILGGERREALCLEEKHRIAVHEAGHVVTALRLDPDSLYGASIIPQGNSLGHIRYVGGERPTSTTEELENSAVIMLGGHVAERLHLGGYLTGSSSDISRAGRLVYELVTQEAAYGYDYVLLNSGRRIESLASDGVKDLAARTVARKLDEFDAKAERIIAESRPLYERIVSALEERETLSRQELLSMAS